MATTKCTACEKILDIDPVKCPYCEVIQPNKAVDSRVLMLQRALVAVVGLAAGFGGGYFAGHKAGLRSVPISVPKAVRAPVAPRRAPRTRPKRTTVSEYEFKKIGAAALIELKREGKYSFVELEDLVVEPNKYLGKPVAVAGKPNSVRIDAKTQTMSLMAGWGTGARLTVNLSGLDSAKKKELLKIQWPPQVIIRMLAGVRLRMFFSSFVNRIGPGPRKRFQPLL